MNIDFYGMTLSPKEEDAQICQKAIEYLKKVIDLAHRRQGIEEEHVNSITGLYIIQQLAKKAMNDEEREQKDLVNANLQVLGYIWKTRIPLGAEGHIRNFAKRLNDRRKAYKDKWPDHEEGKQDKLVLLNFLINNASTLFD